MIDKHSKIIFFISVTQISLAITYWTITDHWPEWGNPKKMTRLQITVTLSIFDVWTKKRQGFKAEC